MSPQSWQQVRWKVSLHHLLVPHFRHGKPKESKMKSFLSAFVCSTFQTRFRDASVCPCVSSYWSVCLFHISDTIPGRQCMSSCFFLLKRLFVPHFRHNSGTPVYVLVFLLTEAFVCSTFQTQFRDASVCPRVSSYWSVCLFHISDTIPGRQCMSSCFFLLKRLFVPHFRHDSGTPVYVLVFLLTEAFVCSTFQTRFRDASVCPRVSSYWSVCLFHISDTIPGRQCMSSCFFLLKQFEDVLIYLNSIKVCSLYVH